MATDQTRDAAGPLDFLPMHRRQVFILVVAVLLAALDGYDALSMAFVAPVLSKAWQLDKTVVGILLSSGLAGMALGSIAISPLADLVGRKPVILGSLVLMTLGATLSALAEGVLVLASARVLTGVGIGTMIAMTTLLSAEFSNVKRRSLAVASVATIGFPLGGVIGGLGASALLTHSGWPSVFAAGAIAGAVLFCLVLAMVPESPVFLETRASADARAKFGAAMIRLGHASFSATFSGAAVRRSSYMTLFAPALRPITLRLITVNLLVAMAAYYLVNWLPQLIADAGFPPATGSLVSAASGLAGFVGGVSLGYLAGRANPARLASIAMIGFALSLAAVGLAPPILPLLIAASASFGFFLAGMTGTLYAVIADAFPSSLRASGMGLVMGVGRIASAVGPAFAGLLFSHGMGRASVSLLFAVAPLIAASLIATFRPRMVASENTIERRN